MNRLSALLLIIGWVSGMPLQAATYGSINDVAVFERTFIGNDTPNLLLGFSTFQSGFVFQDEQTSCDFDAFFPVSGDVILNGGSLNLLRNLLFQQPVSLGPGLVNGNKFTIQFPQNITTFIISPVNCDCIMTLADQLNFSRRVYSSDWSYDSKYVALGLEAHGSHHELQIYELVGDSLVLRASDNVGSNVRTVRWHPNSYRLVTGAISGNELQLWLFDPGIPSVTETDNDNIGDVYALSWTPDGNHVAVGQQNTSTVSVYPVTGGSLGSVITGSLPLFSTVNDLDWNSDGDALAVGLNGTLLGGELQVFLFNGVSLTLDSSQELGVDVNTVRWRPQDALITIGTSNTTEQLEAYMHAPGSLTPETSALVGETKPVHEIVWNPAGTFMALVKSRDLSGLEVELYSYDSAGKEFFYAASYKLDENGQSISWSPDGKFFVATDDQGNVYLLKMTESSLVFKDVKLELGSTTVINSTVEFEGECVLEGGGHLLDLSTTGSLILRDDASLEIRDVVMKGINTSKVRCSNDGSQLIFNNVALILEGDTDFDNGSLVFNGDVRMGGGFAFDYRSTQTILLRSNTFLHLNNGIEFGYFPSDKSPYRVQFTDKTSRLILEDATINAPDGIAFTKGSLDVVDLSFVETNTMVGMMVGNGIAADDFRINIFASESLEIDGAFKYNNASTSLLKTVNGHSRLVIRPNGRFELFQDLTLSPGAIEFFDNTVLARAVSKNILGSVLVFGGLSYETL